MRTGCRGHALHDGIHLFLGVSTVFERGRVGFLDLAARLLNGDEVLIRQHQPRAFLAGPAPGRIFSASSCGRGITWTLTSSPTRRAAAAPASVAALTAPTSPRTVIVT